MPKSETPSTASTGDSLEWARGPGPKVRDLTGLTLGDFRVDRLLGRGGMGEVYLARQISLNREVALKVLRPDLLSNPTYSARFEAEAWAAAKLNEPNIVHIYSLGSIDGMRYIAMEYVQGTNLREYLQRKGPPELMLALSIFRQAGTAIKAAGEVGLVHRDIKPENLLLTRKGLVKVADFGLCRDQDSESPAITSPGVTMGTPLYMSPEQAQGHALDHRSDLYSLGVTAYHMLAGQPPFKGDTPLALALKHVKDTPVDLSVHRPDLPPDLCRLVMKLMEKDPRQRYQSATEMLRELARVREAIIAASTTQAGTAPPTSLVNPSISMPEPTAPERSVKSAAVAEDSPAPRTWGTLATALCLGGLVVGAGVGWLLRPPDLLSNDARKSASPPALWMAPNWAEVPKQATAEAQYRHAQIRSMPGLREAAWLAVPGYFPTAREWASRSYNQLARRLFRDRDPARLRVFAAELGKMERSHEKQLSVIVRAGADVLDGDAQAAINAFDKTFIGSLTDPALSELALEITQESQQLARGDEGLSPTVRGQLHAIQVRLTQNTVEIMFRDVLNKQNIF